MTRRERREWDRWERRELMRSISERDEREERLIEEMMEKIADARVFQAEQIRRGIKPEPITISTDWEAF